jgi:hypothetical protein
MCVLFLFTYGCREGKSVPRSHPMGPCVDITWSGAVGRGRRAGIERIFLVNRGVFVARRLRVYIRSLYNRVITDILVRIQLG